MDNDESCKHNHLLIVINYTVYLDCEQQHTLTRSVKAISNCSDIKCVRISARSRLWVMNRCWRTLPFADNWVEPIHTHKNGFCCRCFCCCKVALCCPHVEHGHNGVAIHLWRNMIATITIFHTTACLQCRVGCCGRHCTIASLTNIYVRADYIQQQIHSLIHKHNENIAGHQ